MTDEIGVEEERVEETAVETAEEKANVAVGGEGDVVVGTEVVVGRTTGGALPEGKAARPAAARLRSATACCCNCCC